MTGVTVITFAEPNVAVVDVRGGAPGSREFAIFGGSKVKLLTSDDPDWLTGVISGTTDDTLELDVDGTRRTVGFRDIKKAQLDYP